MRILIVRTSALGDVVHALPVLTALRRHLPAARIAWVVEAAMAPLLAGHPDLDEVLPVRLRAWRHRLGERAVRRDMRASLQAIHRFRADVALDLMGNHKAGALAWLSGSRRRLGLARSFRREPSSFLWINEPVIPAATEGLGRSREDFHAVDLALAVLAGLGLPAEPADFGPEKLFQGATIAADRLPEEDFVLLSPGAGWGNKEYPPERWAEVARQLAVSPGLPTVVSCGPGEEALAEKVTAAAQGAARSLGVVDLPTLAALMRKARLVLGGDTGPSHLAAALGRPVLFVMGPTDPRRHGPYGRPQDAAFRRLPCSFCYKRFAQAKACLLEVLPGEVADRARSLLLSH